MPVNVSIPSGKQYVFAIDLSCVEEVKSPSDAKQRPWGLAQGHDGLLYVSDDAKDRIYRIL